MGRLLRLLVGTVVLVVLVACQKGTPPVPSPVPTPTPHAAPTTAILQPPDVPATLHVCLGSGPIDVYLSVLSMNAADVGAKDSEFWSRLQAQGGIAGAVSAYAADPSACKVELGATPKVKSVTSIVVQFRDEGEADRAWQSGFFGIAPPPAGELVNGVTRGTGTGLGLSSFVYNRPPVALACWRRSVFVALVVAGGVDANTFKVATSAVDPRLN